MPDSPAYQPIPGQGTPAAMDPSATDQPALPKGLEFLSNLIGAASRLMPNIAVPFEKTKGRAIVMVEDPQALYPNALLPCVDQRFAFRFTNDGANTRLLLTAATVQAIDVFAAGTGDIGTPVGLWWTLQDGDTTLQQNGSFVFRGHTFWAWGHTFSYEGVGYRGGQGASATDPVVKDRNLQDGFGSYAEMIAEAVSTQVGFQIKAQGDECPRFLGNIAYNGDTSQMKGGGLLSIGDASLPFKPWERPFRIGSRDSFNKINGTFQMSVDLQINYIGGNAPTGDVYAFYRIRVCGGRECGEVIPGCQ